MNKKTEVRAIFYDTETTGIRADRDRIIEIAAYDASTGHSFESLINPGISIPPEATAIHNITNEMVSAAPTFKTVMDDFTSFCEGDVILIAHNNDAFDLQFLKEEFKRCGTPMPEWRFLDSLKWARRYRTDLPRHTLQFLRETYGITANNAHRALDDVIVLQQVFALMTDDLSIQEAYQLLNRPRALHHMPFGKHQGTPIKSLPKSYVAWLADSGALSKPENSELKAALESSGLLA